MKHTPGPWAVHWPGYTVEAVHPVRNDATGKTPVAFVTGYFAGQQTANALLIAAAPELYEALQAMLNGVYHYHDTAEQIAGNCGEYQTVRRARAALAKAQGICR